MLKVLKYESIYTPLKNRNVIFNRLIISKTNSLKNLLIYLQKILEKAFLRLNKINWESML